MDIKNFERYFMNINGNEYAIVLGNKGEKALLANMNTTQFVVCGILEDNSWCHGNYFDNFEEAYECYNGL